MTIDVAFATATDANDVRRAVVSLLVELTGDPTRTVTNFAATFAMLAARSGGGILVARDVDSGEIAGVLTYSLQVALRTGGQHCVIQELWVDDSARDRGVGSRLIDFLRHSAEPKVTEFEVGLPGPGYDRLPSTQAFYVRCGFVVIGVRARLRTAPTS